MIGYARHPTTTGAALQDFRTPRTVFLIAKAKPAATIALP